ncbi:hypothetical protein [Rhodococcus sp. T7]|uniref:hypothetical protein n=1 Tax=Rhodococcus sp. T7 TaxID=627444 RepID=UPI00135B3401|nr:hypothetical protein [Rhodococcus sp. T7]
MISYKRLEDVTSRDVETLFASRESDLHRKVDATRDAYFGFIFPITRPDFVAVARAFDLNNEMAKALYSRGTAFSTFRPNGRLGQITNHIVGSSLLALRDMDLDTGLREVSDETLAALISSNEHTVVEIAEARQSWFGRVFFPAIAFANAIAVFGGSVTPESVWDLAQGYGFAAAAGERQTVRGDFGIAMWLTLLART